jgi:hypothetical protein
VILPVLVTVAASWHYFYVISNVLKWEDKNKAHWWNVDSVDFAEVTAFKKCS